MKSLLVVSALALVACNSELTVVSSSGVVTIGSTHMTGTSAELRGAVNPRGLATDGWFEWSHEPSFVKPAATAAQTLGSGGTDVSFTAELTGLVPGDTYYFRAVASNAGGTVRGSMLSFTTPRAPTVDIIPYDQIGNSSNVVNGFVTPNGNATLAWFEYGTDPTFATFGQTTKRSVGSGEDRVALEEILPGMQKYTRYYLRVMASNIGGSTASKVASFGTGGPPEIVSSGFFPNATCDTVQLFAYGFVNGAETRGWFEYSASSSMSEYAATPVQRLQLGATRPVWFGATRPMGTTFYFRAVVSNWLGVDQSEVYTVSCTT